MVLKEIPEGKKGKIISCDGGIGFKIRLSKLGIHIGDIIKVKRNNKISGPVLVETMGREIAIGRNIADRIKMEFSE